mgnify:FL=1
MLLLLLLKMVEEIEEKGEHIWMDEKLCAAIDFRKIRGCIIKR